MLFNTMLDQTTFANTSRIIAIALNTVNFAIALRAEPVLAMCEQDSRITLCEAKRFNMRDKFIVDFVCPFFNLLTFDVKLFFHFFQLLNIHIDIKRQGWLFSLSLLPSLIRVK